MTPRSSFQQSRNATPIRWSRFPRLVVALRCLATALFRSQSADSLSVLETRLKGPFRRTAAAALYRSTSVGGMFPRPREHAASTFTRCASSYWSDGVQNASARIQTQALARVAIAGRADWTSRSIAPPSRRRARHGSGGALATRSS